jgi:hypothetical protein
MDAHFSEHVRAPGLPANPRGRRMPGSAKRAITERIFPHIKPSPGVECPAGMGGCANPGFADERMPTSIISAHLARAGRLPQSGGGARQSASYLANTLEEVADRISIPPYPKYAGTHGKRPFRVTLDFLPPAVIARGYQRVARGKRGSGCLPFDALVGWGLDESGCHSTG